MARRWRVGPIIGYLAGLVVAGALIGIVAVFLGGEFWFPPTRTQSADFWNGPRNESPRRDVEGSGYRWAVVEGWDAAGVYGYCSISFLAGRSGGRWASYVSWVSGRSYPGARRKWSLDVRGPSWDAWAHPEAPDSNASVNEDGSVRLLHRSFQ